MNKESLGINTDLSVMGDYQEITLRYEVSDQALWLYMSQQSRPCFTPALLDELTQVQQRIKSLDQENDINVKYFVLASSVPGVYSFGGDLALFTAMIKNKDRAGLTQYTKACIDAIYLNTIMKPITTISLVQGQALGGGFEAALSSDVLIAEKGSKMGLPEILFNLFPGMGAYNLLCRRLDPQKAQSLISSGEIYSAEAMYDMGIVDMLAAPGEGHQAVQEYIEHHRRCPNGITAINQVRDIINPVRYNQLETIGLLWVDTALKLRPRDLRMMERLVRAQDKLTETTK